MNNYLVITVSKDTIGITDTRKAFAGFYSKSTLETTDLKDIIPSLPDSCKYRVNYDDSMDIVIKLL